MEKGDGCDHVPSSEGVATNLCRRNGSGGGGGRKRRRIRETLASKYIGPHVESIQQSNAYIFSTIFVVACRSCPVPMGTTSKKCPTDFMLVFVVIFHVVIDCQI
jgi:hypothetical protein